MGRSRNDISVHLSTGKVKLRELLHRYDYDLDIAIQERKEVGGGQYHGVTLTASSFVERFAEPATARLTRKELEILGLDVEKFRTNYVTSLVIPGPRDEELVGTKRLYLILTRKSEWNHMKEAIKQVSIPQDNNFQNYRAKGLEDSLDNLWITVPEEYLVRVDIDNDDNIVLTPQNPVYFYPELELQDYLPCPGYDQMYNLTHLGRLNHKYIPIMTVWSDWMIFKSPTRLEKFLSEERIDNKTLLREWLLAKSSEDHPRGIWKDAPEKKDLDSLFFKSDPDIDQDFYLRNSLLESHMWGAWAESLRQIKKISVEELAHQGTGQELHQNKDT